MKGWTDLEQSRKLAEILLLESADMEYMFLKKDGSKVSTVPFVKDNDEPEWPNDSSYDFIPCWSLAALFKVIRESMGYELLCNGTSITIKCELGDNPWSIEINNNNELDACCEIIFKLHEYKIL